MHNERLHGELTFSFSINLDDVNESDPFVLSDDLKRIFSRAISANERFLPRGVVLDEIWLSESDVYTKDDDDRHMDYLMATDPRI